MSENDQQMLDLAELANLAFSSLIQLDEVMELEAPNRRWWVSPINQRRDEQGDYNNLIREMRSSHPDLFFSYTRMTFEQYDYLLELVTPILTKFSNRTPLPPAIRLLVTLRYIFKNPDN